MINLTLYDRVNNREFTKRMNFEDARKLIIRARKGGYRKLVPTLITSDYPEEYQKLSEEI